MAQTVRMISINLPSIHLLYRYYAQFHLTFQVLPKSSLLPSPEPPRCRHNDMANAREHGGAPTHGGGWLPHTSRVPSRNVAERVTEYLIGSVEPLLPFRIANCTAATRAERSYQTTGLDIGRERAMFQA